MPHIEFTREMARRFNHLYGRETGFEEKAQGRGEEDGHQEGAPAQRAAHQVPGAGRRRGARRRRRRCSTSSRTCRSATASACYGYLEGGGKMILVEPEALLTEASQHAGPRRPEDVEELRQHDRAARGARVGDEEDPHHADRSGARAAHRSGRSGEMPGVATCTRSIRTTQTQGMGAARAAPPRASAASNASSR